MHDHDLVESNHGLKPKEPKKDEAGGDHLHVAEAIKSGRSDTLGARGATHLQRAAGNAAAASLLQRDKDEESPVKSVVRQDGDPLPKDTRTVMESKFGADFGDVRVHADGDASDSAKAVGAHAYTVRNHVVFGQGKYDPGSAEGQKVLAHELTHVVQQRNGPVDGSSIGGGVKMSTPGDRFELEAEKTADHLMGGPPTHSNTGDHSGGGPGGAQAMHVQRAGDEEEKEAAAMHVQRAGDEEEKEAAAMHVQRAGDEEEKEAAAMHVQRAEAKGAEEALPEEPEEKAPAQKLDVQRADDREELPE